MRLLKKSLFLIAFSVLAFSCDPGDPEPSINDLSEYVQKFMSMRMGSANAMSKNSMATINTSFQSMMGTHGFSGGRVAGDSTGNDDPGKDSTIYQDPWVSCATFSTLENADGSTTTIYDYGDGCEEGWGDYHYFTHGKTIQTYKYTSERNGSVIRQDYLFKMVYDNYGGHYQMGNDSMEWSMDGNSFYEGYSSYDTIRNKFSGAYSYSDTSLYRYGTTIYDYKSKGSSRYDEKGAIVEVSDYEYGDGSDYYRSHITQPLRYDYSCNGSNETGIVGKYIWVAVSGHEVVRYKQGDKEGSFEIDYGNGECDNIIYITENGVRVAVDLGSGLLFYDVTG